MRKTTAASVAVLKDWRLFELRLVMPMRQDGSMCLLLHQHSLSHICVCSRNMAPQAFCKMLLCTAGKMLLCTDGMLDHTPVRDGIAS